MSKIEHIPCGEFVNESERKAVEHCRTRLNSVAATQTWLLLSNVPSAVNDRAIPDEVDLIAIGPPGLFVIEIKHWDRSYLKSHAIAVEQEAIKLNNKVRRIVGKLRRAGIDPGFVAGRFLLTNDSRAWDANRPMVSGAEFFVLSEWKRLLQIDGATIFDNTTIRKVCEVIQPQARVALHGDVRHIAGIRNLERVGGPDDRFHRIYRGEHVRSRDRVVLHLYDLSASDDPKADRVASREFDALQQLQRLACVPRLMDSFHDVPDYPGELRYFSLLDPGAPTVAQRSEDRGWGVTERRQFAVRALRALADIHASDGEGISFVHRQISPETLLVASDNQPVFTAFDLARISGTMTVSPAAAMTSTAEWIAPEVRTQGLGIADQRSDIFALSATLRLLFQNMDAEDALVAYEALAAGIADKPDQRPSLTTLAESIEGKQHSAPSRSALPSVRFWSEGLDVPFKQSTYRILSRLGSGSFGTTFKVVQIADEQEVGTFAAKVVFDRESGTRSLNAYRNARQHTKHPSLATIFEIESEWTGNSFVAVMDWVDGTPLSEWIGLVDLYAEELGETLLELTGRWIESMCGGLAALHDAGLVHGDVSPANLIESRGELTLVDYDLLLKQGEKVWSIGTPVYAPPGKTTGQPARFSDDIYSLGAAIFHVSTGMEPFWYGGQRRCEAGLNWNEHSRADWGWVAEFLDRATAPQLEERFANATAALQWIRQHKTSSATPGINIVDETIDDVVKKTTSNASEIVPLQVEVVDQPVQPARPESVAGEAERKPQSIPWLKELLATYAGSPRGNIETRGLDSRFANDTYVPTELEAELEDQIIRRKVQLVILCGNAGDGKTAFLQHLAGELGLPRKQSTDRVWSGSVHGLKLKINLDGAASYKSRSSDDLLNEIFAPFHDGPASSNQVHLVAVNDGRLLQWAEGYERETKLTQWIYATLLDDKPEDAPHIRLINLNARSLVGKVETGNDSAGKVTTEFFDRLLDKLLGGRKADEIWKPCQTCTASSRCAAFRSVSLLRSSGSYLVRQVRERLAEALQAVHQRGQVHITTRELRGTLTYILFGTLHCDDLHATADRDGGHYWDRAFDPESELRQGEVLMELPRFDPALNSEPNIDRYLRTALANGVSQRAPAWPEMGKSLISKRRRAWFEWSLSDVQAIAGNPQMLSLYRGERLRLFRDVAGMTADGRHELCQHICDGISRLEQLPRVVQERATELRVVPLKILPRTPVETTFWVEKPMDRFHLEAVRVASDAAIEWLPNELRLTYRSPDGRCESLRMGSDLFSLLLDLHDGYQLTDSSSDDVFANLAIFMRRLAQEDEREIFAWSPADDAVINHVAVKFANNVQQLTLRAMAPGSQEVRNG